MLVNKKALVLKEVIDKEHSTLSHLKVTNKEVIATNGKILLQLKNPSQELLQDFPQVEGLNSTENETYLNEETISKIEKNLPKRASLPILENFVIGEDKEKILIFLTDLENDIKITQRKPEIVDYPKNIEQLYPEESKFKVTLSISLLKQLVKVIEKLSKNEEGITFSFTENTKPIKIEFKDEDVDLKGLIMPMRTL